MRALIVLVVSLLVMVACYGGPQPPDDLANVQTRAASEFACPNVTVKTVEQKCSYGAKYETCHSIYRVYGCQQQAEYYCNDEGCDRWYHTSEITALTVNGQPFVPGGEKACMSGFGGVDFHDEAGDELRIIQNPDFTVEAVFARADGTKSPPLRDCTTLHLRPAADKYAVSGDVALTCAAPGWTLSGTSTFEDAYP